MAAGFSFTVAAAVVAAAPPCFSARAAASISATLSLPPLGFLSGVAGEGFSAAAGGAASTLAVSPGASSPSDFAGAPPLASAFRAAAKMSATVFLLLSGIRSTLVPRWMPEGCGNLGGRSTGAYSVCAAANRGPAAGPTGPRQSVAPQQFIGTAPAWSVRGS